MMIVLEEVTEMVREARARGKQPNFDNIATSTLAGLTLQARP